MNKLRRPLRRSKIYFIFFTLLAVSSVAFGQSDTGGASVLRVSLYVTDSAGRPVTGLVREDIEVNLGGSRVRITGFGEVDEPWSILFIVDDSGSVQNDPKYGQVTRFWEKKIRELAESCNPSNEYGVVVFGQEVERIMSWTPYNPDVFDNSLRRLHEDRKRKGSALYDAIHTSTGMFASASRANRAMILIGDGEETGSDFASTGALISDLRANGIMVFAVNTQELYETPVYYGANVTTARVLAPRHYENQRRYEKLARDTGGINLVAKRNDDINSIFQILNYALRSRYQVEIDAGTVAKAEKDLRVRIVSRNPVLRKLNLTAAYRLEK